MTVKFKGLKRLTDEKGLFYFVDVKEDDAGVKTAILAEPGLSSPSDVKEPVAAKPKKK